jgi:hypothetical protein
MSDTAELPNVPSSPVLSASEPVVEVSSVEAVVDAVEAVVSAPSLSSLSSGVQAIVAALSKKPTSKAEALELYHTLSTLLAQEIMSELPALEKRAALVALWAVDAVSKMGCFGR